MATITTSKTFTLNLRDFLRGLLLAIISAVLTAVLDMLTSTSPNINWRTVGIVAATTCISYLLKNFLSPAQIIVNNPQAAVVEDVKAGRAEVKVQPGK